MALRKQTSNLALLIAAILLFQACAAKAVEPITGGGGESNQPFSNLGQVGNIVQSACEKAGSKKSPDSNLCIIDDTIAKTAGPQCIKPGDCNGNDIPDDEEDNTWFDNHWKGLAVIAGSLVLATGAYRVAAGSDWNLWDQQQSQDRQTNRIVKDSVSGTGLIVDVNNFKSSETKVYFQLENNVPVLSLWTRTEFVGTPGADTRGILANGYTFGNRVEVCIKADYSDAEPLLSNTTIKNSEDNLDYRVSKILLSTNSKLQKDREIDANLFQKFCYDTTEKGYFVLATMGNDPNKGFIVNVPGQAVGFQKSSIDEKKAAFSSIALKDQSLESGQRPEFRFYNSLTGTFSELFTYVNQLNFTCADKVKMARSLLNLVGGQCLEAQEQAKKKEAASPKTTFHYKTDGTSYECRGGKKYQRVKSTTGPGVSIAVPTGESC